MTRSACLLLLAALIAIPQPAAAEDRHALVIGNSKYEGEAALRNPANDADAMEVTLKKLGFKVTKVNEADIDQMEKGVAAFRKSLKKGDVALFFYAGHGLQVKGENFLVPLKASPDDESEVKRKCYAVDNVLEAMESSDSYIKIVILDCCRNNPFKRGWSRSRSEKGMSAIAEIPNGTVIAFATAPGTLAADGKGANSPYTTHLVASLNSRPKEGLELKDALFEASRAVKKETGQVPWMNLEASLEKFYLWRDGQPEIKIAEPKATEPKGTEPPAVVDKPTTPVPAVPARVYKSEYLPLTIGNRWDYVDKSGTTSVHTVTHNDGASATVQSVSRTKDGTTTKSGRAFSVGEKDIYISWDGAMSISPPRKWLDFSGGSPVAGTRWTNEPDSMLLPAEGQSTITETAAKIRVSAGEFTTIVIERTLDYRFRGERLTETVWLAPKVGIVRRKLVRDTGVSIPLGVIVDEQLKSFKVAP